MSLATSVEPLLLHVEAFWVCQWALSCFVALREKNLPFATSLALLGEDQGLLRPYQERTVTARVPALQHGDYWLAESSAIVEYLEERFPPPLYTRLLPEDLRERARARQVMAWLRSDLLALRDEWDSASIFYPVPTPEPSAAARRDIEKLEFAAERLVAPGASHMFRDWCIADVDLAFTLKRLTANGHPVAPHLASYVETQWRRPSVREFAEHPRPPFSRWRPMPSGRRA